MDHKIIFSVDLIEPIIGIYRMQNDKDYKPNPLYITNSELSQVKAIQNEIISTFDKQYTRYAHKKQFYTNINTVTRFSIARQFDQEKVVEMWKNWIKWYEDYKPDRISVDQQIIGKIHQSGKYRYCGFDKGKNPVLVIRMKYHIKGMATAQQNLRYLLYMIEKGVKMAEQAKTYQLSVIYDRRDMAESDDVSKESMKLFMPILSDYYPQTLKAFYVIGANFFYRAMWKIASIFVSKRTEDKINLLTEINELNYFITPDNLDEQYGGTLKIEEVGQITKSN